MRQGRERDAQIPGALPCPAREAENERIRLGRLLRFTTKSAEDTENFLSANYTAVGAQPSKGKQPVADTRYHKSGPD